jgi:hypothetical protein
MEDQKEKLKEFLSLLNELINNYHPYIYKLNKLFEGIHKIEVAILDELNKEVDNSN